MKKKEVHVLKYFIFVDDFYFHFKIEPFDGQRVMHG